MRKSSTPGWSKIKLALVFLAIIGLVGLGTLFAYATGGIRQASSLSSATPDSLVVSVSGYMKQSETVSWATVSGISGYALYRDGVKVSTAGPGATSTKFSVSAGTHTLAVWAQYLIPPTTTAATATTNTSTTTTTAAYFWLDMEGAFPPAGGWATETRRADTLCSGADCGGISVGTVADPLGQEGMVARLHDPYDSTLPLDYLTHALQLTALYSTNASLPHAGYNGTVEETWYHYKVMVPTGNVFSNGESNFLMEWHVNDASSQRAITNCGGQLLSLGLFAYGGYPLTNGGTTSAQWVFRTASGSVDTCTLNQFKYWPSGGTHTLADAAAVAPIITTNVWHDFLFHFKWSSNPALGLSEWWLDGVQQMSIADANLYADSTQTYGHSYGTSAFYNYRYNVTGDSNIYYALFAGGPTRASVGG